MSDVPKPSTHVADSSTPREWTFNELGRVVEYGPDIGETVPDKFIEHSAYAQVRKERDELRAELDKRRMDIASAKDAYHAGQRDATDKLQAELAQAKADVVWHKRVGDVLRQDINHLRAQVLKLEEHIDRLEAGK